MLAALNWMVEDDSSILTVSNYTKVTCSLSFSSVSANANLTSVDTYQTAWRMN